MDNILYNGAYWMLVFQIAINAGYIAFAAAVTGYYLLRHKDLGEGKIDALNEVGFAAFSLVAGIVLIKLLVGGTAPPVLVLIASALTSFIKWPVDYFYRKRVPTPDQLQTQNLYIPNTAAQAHVEEAQMLSKDQNQPQSVQKKYE